MTTFRPIRGVFYGWWLVGVVMLMMTLMALTIFQGLGTFLVALERHFGWSRTALSGAFALARVEGAILGPLEGFLIDKVGSRRMILVGFCLMALGFYLFSQVNSLWQFYVAFLVITLGSGIGGWLSMISLVNNWFVRRRTLALATAMSGIHLGGFLVPVLALGIDNHGFRWTTFGIGVFLLVILGPAMRTLRDRPEDYGMLPDGGPTPSEKHEAGKHILVQEEPDFTTRQALQTPAFWMLTIGNLSSSISSTALALHLVPKLTDMGMSLGNSGLIVLISTAVALPSQFVASYMADRFPKTQVIFVLLLLQAGSVFVIAIADDTYMALLFAVMYGVAFGGRIPLLTAIRGEYFGRKAFATIMGLSQLPNNLGMIVAPLFAGYMFDVTGTYFVPFTIFATLNLAGAFLILFVKRPKIALACRQAE